MKNSFFFGCVGLLMMLTVTLAPTFAQDAPEDEPFVFGLVLLGSENDHGWSQAHVEGGHYVERHVPGSKMLTFARLNPTDNPDTTLGNAVSDMVAQGARLIFTTSDEFQDDTDVVAQRFPGVTFVNISGDHALDGSAPPNVSNLMSKMEWGKLIAGCAAGLATRTGSIGYLGPLINAETRRLAASSYLGARYCLQHYQNVSPDDLIFTVTWIGYWFNQPGITLDPTDEVNTFYEDGADVVISGIDTTEAITVAGQRAAAGEPVFAVPYDYAGACSIAPDVCLGVPYFNWGPSYTRVVLAVKNGTWRQNWDWVGLDWSDINNADTSAIGFTNGAALTDEQSAQLDEFIADLSSYANNPFVPDSFALWAGPLNFQDGTLLAPAGQIVSPLDVWYLDQLLEGMTGASR